jgi:hypothetical protein
VITRENTGDSRQHKSNREWWHGQTVFVRGAHISILFLASCSDHVYIRLPCIITFPPFIKGGRGDFPRCLKANPPLIPPLPKGNVNATTHSGLRSSVEEFSAIHSLHVELGRAIAYVKEKTSAKVAVLTNGSLLYRPEVREGLLKADMVMPTLSTVREETFRAIHQPHNALSLTGIIEGLRSVRKKYRGQLFIEVMLLAGLKDGDEEIEALRQVILEIAPDRVQLNTVVRPPANAKAIPLDRKKLEYIKRVFGGCAEIIATAPIKEKQHFRGPLSAAVLDMTRRRPVTVEDVADALNAPLYKVDKTLKALVNKGELRGQTHLGKDYYTA